MNVNFTPEQEAQLAQLATRAGTDAEHLVRDTVLRLLAGNAGLSSTPPGSVLTEMRALRARIKPDPEGLTTRDYVHYGRRYTAVVVDASLGARGCRRDGFSRGPVTASHRS